MIRTNGRHRAVRLLMSAPLAVAIVAGTASVAAAAPTGTVLQAGTPGAIDGSYIVVLKPGSTAASRVTSSSIALAGRYGGAVRRNYLSTVRGFNATLSSTAARRLAADPSVAYVEQDRVVRLSAVQSVPVWGLDRLDQRSLPLSSSYTYPSASNVTAYVLDTGVRTGHTEFGGRASSGWDFIDKDPVANDCNGHGTHVAGTIGGTTYGVAKDVAIVGVRVLDCGGSGSYAQIIGGIDWVTANAVKPAVANMSLGGGASAALDDAVKRSIAAGVTYALAAGNDNTDACRQSPARTPAAITVGATESTDVRASFSNYGTCLDIFAPGARIVSASHSSDTGATTMSGTSMASPHVAGAAALLLGASPSLTPAKVRDLLVAQATRNVVTKAGTGSPNLLLYTGGIAVPIPSPTPTAAPSPTPTPTASATPKPTVAPTVSPVPTVTVTPTVAPTTIAPPPRSPATCGPFTMGTNVLIMDRATIASTRKVTGCVGNASSASTVKVQIKHSHRGGLVISLTAPNGSVYPLKANPTSDSSNDLDATYTVNASGAPRNGDWTLTVRDSYRKDIGYLDSWTMRL
jgi:subtilisin family serine protease